MKILKLTRRDILPIVFTVCFVGILFIEFNTHVERIGESLRDVCTSFVYYFCDVFNIESSVDPTVLTLPSLDVFPNVILPSSLDEFKGKCNVYFDYFFNNEIFKNYLIKVIVSISDFAEFLVLSIPIVMITIVFKIFEKTEINNDYDKHSRALNLFIKIYNRCIRRFINYLRLTHDYLINRRYYRLWFVLFCLFNGITTVLIEFIAYFFYFAASFNFLTVYIQVYKLLLDLVPLWFFLPIPVWIIIFCIIVNRLRKNIAYRRLEWREAHNAEFIESLSLFVLICGTMGAKKTTLNADMTLTKSVTLRKQATKSMMNCMSLFPNFPWLTFEKVLSNQIKQHTIYNRVTAQNYINVCYERYTKNPTSFNLFGYDTSIYRVRYVGILGIKDLFNVLNTYAQLYWMYSSLSSLIYSTYAIRSGFSRIDYGNAIDYNFSFFNGKNQPSSVYSHILDYDQLRLGQKMIQDNPRAYAYDIGIISITELGKERKNTLELNDVKRKEKSANQKNDGYNNFKKLIRHFCTIDYYPYGQVFADENRASSVGADLRELSDIIHVKRNDDEDLLLPFFFIEEIIYQTIIYPIIQSYMKDRVNEADLTLYKFFLRNIVFSYHNYYTEIYNEFGSTRKTLLIESGAFEGVYEEGFYYLQRQKIYNDVFGTDAYYDVFANRNRRSDIGISDVPCYETTHATTDEFDQQHSYIINEIKNYD